MNKSDLDEKDNLKYKIYLEERKSLIDAEREQSRLFDKAILALAGGAFGLSVTFIREIVPNNKPEKPYYLALAWLFFCASMLSTLISFLTSQHACSRQRELLEINDTEEDRTVQMQNRAATWTWRLNVCSIVLFILGVIFLAVFSIINLRC